MQTQRNVARRQKRLLVRDNYREVEFLHTVKGPCVRTNESVRQATSERLLHAYERWLERGRQLGVSKCLLRLQFLATKCKSLEHLIDQMLQNQPQKV